MRRTKQSIPRKRVILLVPLVSLALTVAALTIIAPRQEADVVNANQTPTPVMADVEVEVVEKLKPSQLIIDSLGIKADTVPVGLTKDGDMDIQNNPKLVAWYKFGPKPGEVGSAVVAGHYGWDENDDPAVFNDVSKLVAGDKISVTDENSQLRTFVVTHTKIYEPDEDAADVFSSFDGKAHLNLITCHGIWDKKADSYSERLVVFTDLI